MDKLTKTWLLEKRFPNHINDWIYSGKPIIYEHKGYEFVFSLVNNEFVVTIENKGNAPAYKDYYAFVRANRILVYLEQYLKQEDKNEELLVGQEERTK